MLQALIDAQTNGLGPTTCAHSTQTLPHMIPVHWHGINLGSKQVHLRWALGNTWMHHTERPPVCLFKKSSTTRAMHHTESWISAVKPIPSQMCRRLLHKRTAAWSGRITLLCQDQGGVFSWSSSHPPPSCPLWNSLPPALPAAPSPGPERSSTRFNRHTPPPLQTPTPWGRLKRSVREVQLFGRLAVLETHTL